MGSPLTSRRSGAIRPRPAREKWRATVAVLAVSASSGVSPGPGQQLQLAVAAVAVARREGGGVGARRQGDARLVQGPPKTRAPRMRVRVI
ncbi:hypothetical protein, partial [Streptomyces clavuligerus]|uniref:hypothetical protein n=1 Tax=Streptomyces clavuligerus TaxID=1901 RepID=UPI0027DE6C87